MTGIPAPFVRANQWFVLLSVILCLITGLPEVLLVPFFVGLYSLAFKQNPVFWLVRPFLKKPPSDYEQEDPEQQRFNQWIAVICLGLSYLGFALGYKVTGYVFMIMVGVASLVAILGFCVGCFIRYQYIQWKHRRQSG